EDGHLGGGKAREDGGSFGRVWISRRRLTDRHGRGGDGKIGQLERYGAHWPCECCVGGPPSVSAQRRCAACRSAVPDCAILYAQRTEDAEPGSAPTGESDCSAQHH